MIIIKCSLNNYKYTEGKKLTPNSFDKVFEFLFMSKLCFKIRNLVQFPEPQRYKPQPTISHRRHLYILPQMGPHNKQIKNHIHRILHSRKKSQLRANIQT